MLTIKAMVKKDGLRVDRKYNVKLCFTYNRKVKRLSTSLFASPEELTKSLSFKEGTILKQKVDKLVETYKEMCDKLQVDAHHFTLDDIIEMIKADEERHKPVDFIQFCQWWITTTTIKGRRNYQSAVNAFITYLGKDHLEVSILSAQILNGFMDYLKKQSNQRAKLSKEEVEDWTKAYFQAIEELGACMFSRDEAVYRKVDEILKETGNYRFL